MKTYFVKLIPPRPTFAESMSEFEASAMREHGAYWREKMAEGITLVFGPVADPAGTFGLGIIQVADEEEARRFLDHDPAIRAGFGLRYELRLMPYGVVHPQFAQEPSRT
jgi:uncharacterized protein YciI